MIEVEGLVKQYGQQKAVDGASFRVQRGEVFGLLGPNGAGKTTTIRCILDIIRPDAGTIRLLGRPPGESTKAGIGYLPEERGLYKNFKLLECLTYLGALKGVTRSDARRQAEGLLDRLGLADYANRKVKELSRGMAQKAQFLAALVHQPDLLILDEPFQGLDPVNTDLLRTLLLEEQARGRTIVLSSHNMNQVEELCGRILLIDHGRLVLYGSLEEIRAQYAEHAVVLECDGPPPPLEGVRRIDRQNHAYLLALESELSPDRLLRQLVDLQVPIRRFEIATPPLEEIFIRAVGVER